MRKRFFSYIPAGTLSSVLKIQLFAKKIFYNFILQALFQSAQHVYENREGSGSGAGSGSIPLSLNNGSGSGGPKTSGSPTLAIAQSFGSGQGFFQNADCGWESCLFLNLAFFTISDSVRQFKFLIIFKSLKMAKRNPSLYGMFRADRKCLITF